MHDRLQQSRENRYEQQRCIFFNGDLTILFFFCLQIRHPLKNRSGPDALLVFLPGALTPPSAYTELLHAIQTESELRLWVVTIIFTNDVANEPEIRERYQSARKALKVHGFPGEESSSINVFFAGHRYDISACICPL